MIQKAMTYNPRMTVTAAALVFGAVALNPYSPPPAAGATMEEILAPATLPQQLQKAKEQCESINTNSRVLDWSITGMATGLGLVLGMPGVPDVALGFYRALNPDTALRPKQMDCDAEVKKIEPAIAMDLPFRNMLAERGLTALQRADNKSKQLAFHYRNFIKYDDRVIFVKRSDAMHGRGRHEAFAASEQLLSKVFKLDQDALNLPRIP